MTPPEGTSPPLTRRSLLLAAAASLCPVRAMAQSQDQGLIIRPEIKGVDPRYAAYASVGRYTVPGSPVTFLTPRGRIVVFHPQGLPSARLVVFSHGALADPMAYRGLLQHWASHGFVVAAPLHDDAAIERGLTLRHSSANGIAEWKISGLLEDQRAWRERSDACSGCLDAISLISQATGVKVIDDRPVIAGQGYGAFVSQLLLGTRVRSSEGAAPDFRDPRFFAGILMSPQGAGVMGLDSQSWAELAAPVLSLVTQGERDFTGQPAEKKADPFRLSKAGYKHLALLKGGSATSFAGQSATANPSEAKLFEVIKAITTAFLLAYSSYDEAAFADMGSGFFQRQSLGAVTESRR